MTKVLFIGPYRQKDSWGKEARSYILSMLTNTQLQLSTRPIYYTGLTEDDIPKDIIQCEQTSYNNYDIILQHAIPGSFHRSNLAKKNIGIVNVEFDRGNSVFNRLVLNNLDEIYVSTEHEKKALISNQITTPIKVIPKPVDWNTITTSLSHKIQFPATVENGFKFYCRAKNDERSNLAILITAFHTTFSELDRVSLIIVSDGDNQTKNSIEQLCKQIKSNFHSNRVFRNEIIICDQLEDKATIAIHNSCDCFINVHSGCHFDTDTLIAMYLGKTPIVMQNTGLEAIVKGSEGGFLVKSDIHPIVLNTPPLPENYDLFNASYSWRRPSVYSLSENLRKAYELYKNDRSVYKNKQQIGSSIIDQYSYSYIGQQLCN